MKKKIKKRNKALCPVKCCCYCFVINDHHSGKYIAHINDKIIIKHIDKLDMLKESMCIYEFGRSIEFIKGYKTNPYHNQYELNIVAVIFDNIALSRKEQLMVVQKILSLTAILLLRISLCAVLQRCDENTFACTISV